MQESIWVKRKCQWVWYSKPDGFHMKKNHICDSKKLFPESFRSLYRVSTSPERWWITLFSQLTLISQLCPYHFEKLNYYTLRNRNSWYVLLLFFTWKTVSHGHFISFLDPLMITALNPSFHCVLAFAWLIFVLVENY